MSKNYIIYRIDIGVWGYEEFRGMIYPFAMIFRASELEVIKKVEAKNESK